METLVKGIHQQQFQFYRVVKAGQLLHQGKWLTWSQIRHKFPHMMGVTMQNEAHQNQSH
jgi:hypothetical protein